MRMAALHVSCIVGFFIGLWATKAMVNKFEQYELQVLWNGTWDQYCTELTVQRVTTEDGTHFLPSIAHHACTNNRTEAAAQALLGGVQ